MTRIGKQGPRSDEGRGGDAPRSRGPLDERTGQWLTEEPHWAREWKALFADLVGVRETLQSRADRLRYLLNGRTSPFMLAQLEAYDDASAELSELLARYDPDPGRIADKSGRTRRLPKD